MNQWTFATVNDRHLKRSPPAARVRGARGASLDAADAYYGQGFAMHMIVTRLELEAFAYELEKECTEFKRKHRTDEAPEGNA